MENHRLKCCILLGACTIMFHNSPTPWNHSYELFSSRYICNYKSLASSFNQDYVNTIYRFYSVKHWTQLGWIVHDKPFDYIYNERNFAGYTHQFQLRANLQCAHNFTQSQIQIIDFRRTVLICLCVRWLWMLSDMNPKLRS